MDLLVQFGPLLLLLVVMYFLLIRPQKKKEQEVNSMRNSIKVGDDIITIGGIYGKVVKVKEDKLTIQVGADKTKFDITRWAVSKVEKSAPSSSVSSKEKDEAEAVKKPNPKKLKRLGGGSDSEELPEDKENPAEF